MRKLTESFAACCRPPMPEIFKSAVERARLNFDATSAVMKDAWDPQSNKARTINVFPSISFMPTIAVIRRNERPLNVAPLVTPLCYSTGRSKCSDVWCRPLQVRQLNFDGKSATKCRPDNSCTVWASSPVPPSHVCPTACSNDTGRLNGTHCNLSNDNLRSAQQLRCRFLDAPS